MEDDKKREEQKPNIHRKYSLIKSMFTVDQLIEITKISMMSCDNNTKCVYIREYLTNEGIQFGGLGPGTNRYGINMRSTQGMVAVKIALDRDGMIDNRREFLYGKDLYPDVCKIYECLPNGLIAVFEYVIPFTLMDFKEYENNIREILERISSTYMIGDVGINTDNYKNWGIRNIGDRTEICMLDFAYIYKISYKLFTCNCDGITLLHYDDNYVDLICPKCGRKFQFSEIRRRITRKMQEEEIGDIRKLGYVLHSGEEMLPDVTAFLPKKDQKKAKKKGKLSEFDRIKQIDRMRKDPRNDPYALAYNTIIGGKEDEQEE